MFSCPNLIVPVTCCPKCFTVMGATFTPVFNRTNAKNKSGYYSIHIRVTLDRQTKYLNPDLPKLKPEHWLTKPKANKWVKDTHPQHFEINRALRKEVDELYEYYNKLKAGRISVTFAKLKKYYDRKGNKESFIEYVDFYLKDTKFKKDGTRKKYRTFQLHITKHYPNLCFHHLDEQFLIDFKDLLLGKGLKGESVKKYIIPFKKIVRTAVKNHYILSDPFYDVQLDIPVEKPVRVSLTPEEIRKLLDLEFDLEQNHLARHRDVFVFMCCCGLYYKVVQTLTKDNLNKGKNGYIIEGDRLKTGVQFIIPIFKIKVGEELLTKYTAMDNHFLFPTITEPAFNRALKEIAALAGIEKNITNKVARHTFTDLMISKGFPRQFVSKMLGHKKEQTTQIYYEMNAYHMAGGLDSFDDVVF